MKAEKLQIKLREQTGRLYVVKDANPFNENSMFQLSEEGLKGLHLHQATAEEIEGFVFRPLFDGSKK